MYAVRNDTFHAYRINAKVQKEAHGTRIIIFLNEKRFLTLYITNESLLQAKSNFGMQANIKNGPKSYDKLPLTTTKIIVRSFGWRACAPLD